MPPLKPTTLTLDTLIITMIPSYSDCRSSTTWYFSYGQLLCNVIAVTKTYLANPHMNIEHNNVSYQWTDVHHAKNTMVYLTQLAIVTRSS
jgi:hypothetical protein